MTAGASATRRLTGRRRRGTAGSGRVESTDASELPPAESSRPAGATGTTGAAGATAGRPGVRRRRPGERAQGRGAAGGGKGRPSTRSSGSADRRASGDRRIEPRRRRIRAGSGQAGRARHRRRPAAGRRTGTSSGRGDRRPAGARHRQRLAPAPFRRSGSRPGSDARRPPATAENDPHAFRRGSPCTDLQAAPVTTSSRCRAGRSSGATSPAGAHVRSRAATVTSTRGAGVPRDRPGARFPTSGSAAGARHHRAVPPRGSGPTAHGTSGRTPVPFDPRGARPRPSRRPRQPGHEHERRRGHRRPLDAPPAAARDRGRHPQRRGRGDRAAPGAAGRAGRVGLWGLRAGPLPRCAAGHQAGRRRGAGRGRRPRAGRAGGVPERPLA